MMSTMSPEMARALAVPTHAVRRQREEAAAALARGELPPPTTPAVPAFNLRDVRSVRDLTVMLQESNKITFWNDGSGATPEQCIAKLLQAHADDIQMTRELPASQRGLVGVAAQQTYTRRIRDGNEFVCHLSEPGVYQHQIMSLDNTSFDFATNLGIIVHFERGTTVEEAERTEVCLTCCRFVVFSTKLRITKSLRGDVMGEAQLLQAPNMMQLRHTHCAAPSWIMLREHGRIVTQTDIHMHGVLVAKLLDQHWFATPAKLPVCVEAGMARFDRVAFLASVPREFLHRYTLPGDVRNENEDDE